MIRIARGDKPKILADNETQWTSDYLEKVSAFAVTPSSENKKSKTKAEAKYRHPRIKEALKTAFSGKCAYCESHVVHIDYGDIEHFRPKSKFPELCFHWKNLLLSCGICNDTAHKGDHFPDSEEGGPLVNPADENPDEFFYFEFDPATGTANVLPKNQRGHTTELILGLNRKELVQHRSAVVRKMVYVAICASQGDNEALHEISSCCSKENEYSAFARSLVYRFSLPLL
jgi:uncharacterized protein (TIGR02646 family)